MSHFFSILDKFLFLLTPYNIFLKLTITYAQNSFRAFPISKLECVTANSDTASGDDLSCSKCNGADMAHSLADSDWHQTCQLNSVNSVFSDLSTVYCSQIAYGSYPFIVASCYQGSFSAESPLISTPCPQIPLPSSPNTNSVWCAVSFLVYSCVNVFPFAFHDNPVA